MALMTKEDLTIAEMQLLKTVYENLIDAGLVLAVVEYDKFIEAALTGDSMSYEEIV